MRKLKSARWAVRVAALTASAVTGALVFAASAAASEVQWGFIGH